MGDTRRTITIATDGMLQAEQITSNLHGDGNVYVIVTATLNKKVAMGVRDPYQKLFDFAASGTMQSVGTIGGATAVINITATPELRNSLNDARLFITAAGALSAKGNISGSTSFGFGSPGDVKVLQVLTGGSWEQPLPPAENLVKQISGATALFVSDNQPADVKVIHTLTAVA